MKFLEITRDGERVTSLPQERDSFHGFEQHSKVFRERREAARCVWKAPPEREDQQGRGQHCSFLCSAGSWWMLLSGPRLRSCHPGAQWEIT